MTTLAAAPATTAPPLLATALPDLQADLAQALALADAAPDLRAAAVALRARYAPRRMVVVDAADMRDETPAAIGQHVQLFYAVSDGHCWQVSASGEQAAGYFISGSRS
jgi:hypothetical protein